MSDDADRVLAATDLVALVGETVRLKRRGVQLYGLCPMHPDKDPTLRVDPKKKLYYCPACGEGGNAIHWIRQRDGLGFKRALVVLAARAGLSLEPDGAERAPAPALPPLEPNSPHPRVEPVTPWGGQHLLSDDHRPVFIYERFPGRRAYLDRADRFPGIDFLYWPDGAMDAGRMYLPPIADRRILLDAPTSLWAAHQCYDLLVAVAWFRHRHGGAQDPMQGVDLLSRIESAAAALALWMEGRERVPGLVAAAV
jgi:hypothetical protein